MIPFTEDREGPKNFWAWLKKRYAHHKKGNEDTVVVVCGKEQLGKSRWTLRTEWCLDKEQFIKEGKIDIDKIVFNGEDYRYQVTHNKKSIVHDDEAITHFYSRRAMGEENVLCNQTLAQCGYNHNLQFILIPSFFVLDTYIREHRVHAVVKIFPGNKFKTWVFTKNTKKLEKILATKSFAVSPSSKGWWSEDNDDEFKKFIKEYRKKEDKYKKESGKKREIPNEKPKSEYDIRIETALKAKAELGLTTIDAAKIAGVTRQTLAKKEKQNVIM